MKKMLIIFAIHLSLSAIILISLHGLIYTPSMANVSVLAVTACELGRFGKAVRQGELFA